METSPKKTSRECAKRKIRRTIIGQMVHAIGKWILVTMLCLIFILGSFDVYDFLFPEKVPHITNIGICTESKMALEIDREWDKLSDDLEYNWRKLQPAITVLRKVCPEAADWVVNRHDNDKIIWDNTRDGTFARYDNLKGTLFLNQSMLLRRHGDIAATLAHEFRHSRQNLTKSAKVAIFLSMTGINLGHIVENDAVKFEMEVYIAIFD